MPPEALELQTLSHRVAALVPRPLGQKQLWSSSLRVDTISVQGPEIHIDGRTTRQEMMKIRNGIVCDGDQVLCWVHEYVDRIYTWNWRC